MQTLPVVYITADTNYEVGKSIGTTFRGFITDFINNSKDVELYRRFYSHSECRTIYDSYLTNSEQYFPEIVDEIRGIADGSGQSFADIFLLQLASEVRHSHRHEFPELNDVKTTTSTEDKGCTDILVNTKDLRMIAHNEDWSIEVYEYVYMCHVTIANQNGGQHVVKERFVSFMYPGHLAGFCFGMNEDLVMSLNSVRPVTANRKGVPSAIVLRKLMACKTIDECATVLENKPLGCAFGVNVNIAHVHDDLMCSLESYQEESKTRVSIRRVKDAHYVHTNHYIHTANPLEKPADGSFIRHQRADEMMTSHPAISGGDVRRVLGDTNNVQEPVYRTPSEKHLTPMSQTTATAMFDMTARRLDVYRTNPKQANQPCFSMDFLCS